MKYLAIIFSLIFSLNSFSYYKTPIMDIAPGHLCTTTDKDFNRFRYKEQLPYCKRNVRTRTKDRICALYGVTSREDRRNNYTVDHIIPLSMGGSNSEKNLWCQYRGIYTGYIEYWLYRKLETSELRQAEVLLYILSHKYNPKGKDHVPLPPGGLQNESGYQSRWEQRQKPVWPRF